MQTVQPVDIQQSSAPTVLRQAGQHVVTLSLVPFMAVGAIAHHVVLGVVSGYRWANGAVVNLMDD